MTRCLIPLMLIVVILAVSTNGANEGVTERPEKVPWWETTSMDLDRDGIHDAIERADGRWFDIFIDYDHDPDEADLARLEALGVEVYYVDHGIDLVTSYRVPREVIDDIARLPHVVLVEEQGWLVACLDTAAPAVKARKSDEYSPRTAWELGYTGENVNIAILDTGVDDGHESLDGKYVAGVDVSNPPLIITTNPDDGNGHGTHVAGIAMGNGGQTDNDNDGEPDFMGAAPDASLIDVKISTDAGFSAGTLVAGIDWCIEHKDDDWGDSDPDNDGIDILSISFGQPDADNNGDDATSRKVNEAVGEGLIVVVAAGNDGNDHRGFGGPASADLAITVGGVDNADTIGRWDDTIGSYSNRGPRRDDGDDNHTEELKPEVVAPGTDIMSCSYNPISQVGIGYENKTGTSMACPFVSGIIACMLQARPDLDANRTEYLLTMSAERHGDPYDPALSDKYNDLWGYGYVDAYWAVRLALGDTSGSVVDETVNCIITEPRDGTEVSGTINITGLTSISDGTVDEVVVWWDNGTEIEAHPWNGSWERWYLEFDTTNLSVGPHRLSAMARAGLRESDVDEINVTVTRLAGKEGGEKGLLPFPSEIALIALPAAMLLFRDRRGR